MKIKFIKSLRSYRIYKRDLTGNLHRYHKNITHVRIQKKRVKKVLRRIHPKYFIKRQKQKPIRFRQEIGAVRIRRRRKSRYGKLIFRKMRLRQYYGITRERQFASHIRTGLKKSFLREEIKKNKLTRTISSFETRLDVILVRVQFFRTIHIARQAIQTGHVYVNSHQITIPNYQIKVNDIINITLNQSIQNHLYSNIMRRGVYIAKKNSTKLKKGRLPFLNIIETIRLAQLKRSKLWREKIIQYFFKPRKKMIVVRRYPYLVLKEKKKKKAKKTV